MCANHESSCGATIHAMSQILKEEDSEAHLLTDAFADFNVVNRKLFLYKVSVICPEIARNLLEIAITSHGDPL